MVLAVPCGMARLSEHLIARLICVSGASHRILPCTRFDRMFTLNLRVYRPYNIGVIISAEVSFHLSYTVLYMG